MVESCPEEPTSSCCGPHVFTSVLLGVLACVLMTGGVFLAFHRWDPLWLIVSGIGVILVLIGSILHCCRTKQPVPGKGCCLPDHLHNHVVLNGGSLTEQLLPLSNARSVSQLSLNMLPGYFPPVVATYGIEQHSAVVQNINRIMQQQAQNPATNGSPGKSFILLSLPGNTPQANIQNLVATVYQLDGSVLAETSTASDISPPPTTSVSTSSTSPQGNLPIRKNAEVQTCTVWSVPNSVNVATNMMMPSTSTASSESVIMSTQTDEPFVSINLMDCSPDPICDISSNLASLDANSSTPPVFVDVSENAVTNIHSETHRNSVRDSSDSAIDSILEISSLPSANIPPILSNVLIDILESSTEPQTSVENNENLHVGSVLNSDVNNTTLNATESNEPIDIILVSTDSPRVILNNLNEQPIESLSSATGLSNSNDAFAIPSTNTASDTNTFQNDHSENSSLCVVDVEDCDSLDRSSPPPSYDDVALQNDGSVGGMFGLAYGTL